MTVLVHFSGPSYSKSVVLQPGAAPMEVGRDAQAGVYLPDHDRLISRRHIALEWDESGARVTVLSKVNGVTTPRGEFGAGQSIVLAPGETGQLGRYSFLVETSTATVPAPLPSVAAPLEDPFQVFGAGSAAGPSSVFDDPFFAPTRSPQHEALDTPAALDAMSGRPAHAPASFSGAGGAELDPLAAFGGQQRPVYSSVSIDEFLGTPGIEPRGLGAAQLLNANAQPPERRLAIDHVHDFNLPLGPSQVQAAAPMPPMAPVPPAPAPAKSDDPWAAFASDWVPPGAAPRKEKGPAFPAPDQAPLNRAFDDAFSSSTAWRVEDMPDPLASASFVNEQAIGQAFSVPDEPSPMAARADPGGSEAALRALCQGLGIAGPPQLADKDWQQLGKAIRQIVQGLSDLMNVRAELKKEMRATDRTMLGAQENNPLKSGMPLDELLQYLLFMPQGAAGYLPAQRALAETIADLRAHEFASLAAVRAVVEGSIKEFEPAKLRSTLMKGKRSFASVVDNARLWDLYTTHYQHKGEHMADWLEQVFNRHFMPAYSREAERLRREGQATPPERRN